MLSVTDFNPKGIISGVRVQAGLYLDMLDADRSPNAVSGHTGNSQVDFEVDCPPPANSPPGDLFITMVKETVILYIYMSHPIAGRYPIAVTLPIAVTFSMKHMKMILSELFSL